MQINLFAEETQLQKLTKLGDSLEKLNIICADGKKTALGCAGRTFLIAANRVAGTILLS